jgi:hypothetical protein
MTAAVAAALPCLQQRQLVTAAAPAQHWCGLLVLVLHTLLFDCGSFKLLHLYTPCFLYIHCDAQIYGLCCGYVDYVVDSRTAVRRLMLTQPVWCAVVGVPSWRVQLMDSKHLCFDVCG